MSPFTTYIASCFSTLNWTRIYSLSAVNTIPWLARFAPWQIGGLYRLTVADGKQKDAALRAPAGIVFGQIRSIHRLHGDPLPIWGNGDTLGNRRNGG
jgi:hypothetical protein